jgi:hypothetical protein
MVRRVCAVALAFAVGTAMRHQTFGRGNSRKYTLPNETTPHQRRPKSGWDRLELGVWAVFAGIIGVASTAGFVFPGHWQPAALFLALLGISILALRERHADEVYLLFLTFAAVLYLCLSVMFFVNSGNAYSNGALYPALIINDSPTGILNIFKWYVETSRDVYSEVAIIYFFTGVVFVPQALGFLLAGLFGCARQPVYLRIVEKYAMLCIIKVFAAYSGIEMAFFIYLYYHSTGAGYAEEIFVHLNASLNALAIAFLVACIYFEFGTFLNSIIQRDPTGILRKLATQMARFTT